MHLMGHLFYLIIQQFFNPFWLIIGLSVFSRSVLPATLDQGQVDFYQGHFEQAIRYWQVALKKTDLGNSQRLDIMMQLARAYQALGLSQQALSILKQAEKQVQSLIDNHSFNHQEALVLALLFTSLSDIYLATRQDNQARYYADKSVALLPVEVPTLIKATVFNNLGNVLTVEAYYDKAIKTYTQSIQWAQQSDETILTVNALINRAYAYFKTKQWQLAVNSLSQAGQQLKPLEKNYTKAFSLLSIGSWAQRIEHQMTLNIDFKPSRFQRQNLSALRTIAYQTLEQALHIAEKIKNHRLTSYAYGLLGYLYEQEQRYEDALPLTRQAIFFAQQDQTSFFTQQAQASDILYRWQWQLGRLFKIQKQIEPAIKAYQNAVKSLQQPFIRQELATGYRNTFQSFRDRIGPIYFELADLLLQQARRRTQDDLSAQRWLKEAVDTIELMKAAELQDYFQDECVTKSQIKRHLLEINREREAVIYPIVLPQRTEILLSLPHKIYQFSVPITARQLKDEVNEFRFELETRNTNDFLPYAKRLYHWLMAPVSELITQHHIEVLIVVPDGVLRTIPFAALHDGQQFLVSQYAIVTSPGLTLTSSHSNSPQHPDQILIGALSVSTQGYPALFSVQEETQWLKNLYAQEATLLLNDSFTVEQFANALKNKVYSIVHLASHGQFNSNPQKTFLLTYEGQLTVDALEDLIGFNERRKTPMELLSLSACQTAVGDDQAALGLAGIALKAGVKSALASLWFIDDKATSILMSEFYWQLKEKQRSKAKALQAAQQRLLKQDSYQHPAYWAPFLLIGNWD